MKENAIFKDHYPNFDPTQAEIEHNACAFSLL